MVMTQLMPQEIEVWYLLPALRRALSQFFKEEYNLKQKDIADLLGLTEAAVSQYTRAKRGKALKFSKKELALIKAAGKKMMQHPDKSLEYMYLLSVALKGSPGMCALHHKYDKSLAKDCKICCE